jgi:uncharacterized protein (DUF488 family)
MTELQILTIGHSRHSLEAFVALLSRHGVTALADVRSAPHSKFAPQLDKDALQSSVGEFGIKYAFLGRELGGRPADQTCYEDGRVRYGRLAQTDLFRAGLRRVMSGAQHERIALMCTEKDPLDCHRALLVARQLVDRGLAVDHILANGEVESHRSSMLRLLDKIGQSQPDLFTSIEDRIEAAVEKQEARIAYVSEALVRPGGAA